MTGLRDSQAHAIRQSRELMAAVTDQKPTPFAGRCGYCGAHTVGKACGSHRDLLLLEHAHMRAAA